MELLFSPLFSGSSGNCTYVGSRDAGVIVDCGVSATSALSQLNEAHISPGAVKAVLVTHEHTDHIGGAGVLARKLSVPLYATQGTWEGGLGKRAGKLDPSQIRVISPFEDFFVGDMNVMAFPTPHDCLEPCGFGFTLGSLRAAIATDIGYVNSKWLDAVEGADLVLLEADYDEDMLLAGSYPYDLKMRIRGRRGHLSNEDAGRAAAHLVSKGTRQIILGHLSKNNNFPELAEETCEGILFEHGIRAGRDVGLSVAKRDSLTGVFRIAEN